MLDLSPRQLIELFTIPDVAWDYTHHCPKQSQWEPLLYVDNRLPEFFDLGFVHHAYVPGV
jgi:hypothetical protein